MSRDRTDIYYWKCDREAAFHGTSDYVKDQSALLAQLDAALRARFGNALTNLRVAAGQGNHRTFRAELDGRDVFIRTEDGVEQDNYFAVEAEATRRVAATGVPVAETLAFDCSREKTSFAWQIIPYYPFADLNTAVKAGTADWTRLAPQIGRAIASWQEIEPEGFGPFSAARAGAGEGLKGLHATHTAYYRLNLARHVDYLVRESFLAESEAARIMDAVARHARLLEPERGVLVHKDLAVWNILGTPEDAKVYIDWDDCVGGDAMDDLSLMGVTGGVETQQMIASYAAVRGLPPNAEPRFWLDWLRNIVFKAVIRVGAGYFRKDGDGFFLIGAGQNGNGLEAVTRRKIACALDALEKGLGFEVIA